MKNTLILWFATVVITLLALLRVSYATPHFTTEAVMLNDQALKTGGLEQATFAAGCFWCVESEFQAIKGVKEVISGYTGGTIENPSYEQVSGHDTGHYEAVSVIYDPNILSYEKLLEAFWLIHDPTQPDGQGVDIGPQYRSVIFYHNEAQKAAAGASKAAADASGKFKRPIATQILPAGTFYQAESYHQDYYAKHGVEYKSVFEQGGESTTMKKRRGWFGGIFGN